MKPMGALAGVLRLMRGRMDGLAEFGATPAAFLASLAPLVAFALVGAVLLANQPSVSAGFTGLFLELLVVHLAPPVVSHAIARYWDREDWWLRYATAYNWLQCALPLAVLPLAIVMQVLIGLGMPAGSAVRVGVVLFVGYVLWLQWMLARHGLDLSRGRGAAVVAGVYFGTYVLAIGPERLADWLGG